MKIRNMLGSALAAGLLAWFAIPAVAGGNATALARNGLQPAVQTTHHSKCGNGKCSGNCKGKNKGKNSGNKSGKSKSSS